MYIVSFDITFIENAVLLAKRLNIEFVQEMNPQPKDIVIVFGAYACPDVLVELQKKINLEYIIIQTAQYYGKEFDNKYYLELLNNNVALDWSKENIKRIKRHMPNLSFYSLFFYEFFIQNNLPDFESRHIDFYFNGEYSLERDLILKDFKFKNMEYNIVIDLSNNKNQKEVNDTLQNVKYVINLPTVKYIVLNIHYINKALYMGCNVVSFPGIDVDLHNLYKNYIYIVPRLCDFTLLVEQEPKKPIIDLIETHGVYQIEDMLKGLLYAEKKLKEKIKNKKLLNDNSSF